MLDMYGYHLALKVFRYEIAVELCWYVFFYRTSLPATAMLSLVGNFPFQ